MAHVLKTDNGKWECRWSWKDASGKRHFQKERFSRKTEALVKQRELENRAATAQSLDHNPGKVTVQVWAERWMASLDGKKKHSTLRGYRKILDASVLPRLGHRAVAG